MLALTIHGVWATTCVPVHSTTGFCKDVRWNASMGLSAVEMDAAARSDYEVAVETLAKPGRAPPSAMCLDSWRSLQCASKFPKCTPGMPPRKVRMASHPLLRVRQPRSEVRTCWCPAGLSFAVLPVRARV